MKEIQFDINEKPTYVTEHVAYLVDNINVKLMRQYIEQWYVHPISGYSWSLWFDDVIGDKISKNLDNKYYLYFKSEQSLGWDKIIDDSVAESHEYDVYYVVPYQVMTME